MEILELPKIVDEEMKELAVYQTQALSVLDEAKMVAKAIHDAATAEAASQWCAAKLGWCDRIRASYLGRVRDYFLKGHRDAIAEIDKYVVPVEGKKGAKGDTGGAVGLVAGAIRAWRAQEAKRVEDDRRAKFEEARKRDEEERLKAAEKLEADGNKTMADAVLSQAGNFVAPVVPDFKSKSHSAKKVWKIRIDPSKRGELLKMIAEKPELHSFVEISETKIKAQAKLMNGNLNWPGVTCYEEEDLGFNRRDF